MNQLVKITNWFKGQLKAKACVQLRVYILKLSDLGGYILVEQHLAQHNAKC